MRRERVAQGMRSQPALAKAAGISPRKVSDVERGERAGVKTYAAIDRALGFPLGTLTNYLDGKIDALPEGASGEVVGTEPWQPVLADERIIAMTSHEIAAHYVKLDNEFGKAAADDWMFHAAAIRYDARRAAQGAVTEGSANN